MTWFRDVSPEVDTELIRGRPCGQWEGHFTRSQDGRRSQDCGDKKKTGTTNQERIRRVRSWWCLSFEIAETAGLWETRHRTHYL